MKFIRVLFCCLALLFLISTQVRAQSTTATISGIVMDQQGAVIPKARIYLVRTSQNLHRQADTNASGQFTIPLLPPGTYRLVAVHSGFKAVHVENIVLNVASERTLEIKLMVGALQESVTVSANEVSVNLSSAVSTTIDQRLVEDLPLNGRSLQSLMLLAPGVQSAPLTSNQVGQFSVNGQRTSANYFTVDGVSANTGVAAGSSPSTTSMYLAGGLPTLNALGTTTNLVSVDALQEFTIQTSTYSAEFGRQPGGQIQLATKSGANTPHGSAFDYLRNEFFDARNYFQRNCTTIPCVTNPKTKVRQNEFGGTFGGPLMIPHLYDGRNRTFFFFSYEGQYLQLPNTLTNQNVPTAAFRAEAKSAGAATAAILNAFPLPNGGDLSGSQDAVGNYTWGILNENFSNPSHTNATSIRVDQNVGNKLTLFARYAYTPSFYQSRNNAVLSGTISQDQVGTLGATWIITPALTNELRLNYTRTLGQLSNVADSFGGATPITAAALNSTYTGGGIQQSEVDLEYDGGSASLNVGDSERTYQRQYSFTDNITYSRGHHLLRAGVDIRELRPIFGPYNFSSGYSFTDDYSTGSFVSGDQAVLTDTVTGYVNSARLPEHLHFNNFSTYVDDTWKTNKRLTLNLGLRWDVNPPPSEESGRKPTLVLGVNDLATARLSTASDPLYKTDYSGFAPRVGASILIHDSPGRETVLRGGFGVFYDLGSGQATAGYTGYPFIATSQYYSGYSNNEVTFPVPASIAVRPSFSPITLPTYHTLYALNPNLKLPLTMQWNATLQQSFGRQTLSLGYVGSSGQRLLTTQYLNQTIGDPYSSTPTVPNPNFGTIVYTTNQPTSIYNSLQAQFRRPLASGLDLLVNYTWSHSIDESSDEFSAGLLDRSNSDFDVRQNFTTAVLYEIPQLRMTEAWPSYLAASLKAAINGWQIQGIAIAHTGTPGNISLGSFTSTSGIQINMRPDLVPGVPLWVPSDTLGGKEINLNAFTIPPYETGQFGNFYFNQQGDVPRNFVRLPGLYQFNLGVQREVKVQDGFSIKFRAEQFNVLNHPMPGYWNTTINFFNDGSSNPVANLPSFNTTFGIPQGTANSSLSGTNSLYNLGGPRSMQFSLRAQF